MKDDPQKIIRETTNIFGGEVHRGDCPPLWDGHTAERIVKIPAEKGIGRLKGALEGR